MTLPSFFYLWLDNQYFTICFFENSVYGDFTAALVIMCFVKQLQYSVDICLYFLESVRHWWCLVTLDRTRSRSQLDSWTDSVDRTPLLAQRSTQASIVNRFPLQAQTEFCCAYDRLERRKPLVLVTSESVRLVQDSLPGYSGTRPKMSAETKTLPFIEQTL